MMLSSQSKMNIAPKFRPVLDPEFVPASLWNRAFASAVARSGGGEPLALALERRPSETGLFPLWRPRLRLRVHGRARLRPADVHRTRLLRRRPRRARNHRASRPPPRRLPYRL